MAPDPLVSALAAAAASWPTFVVPAEPLRAFVEERLRPGEDAAALVLPDLVLSCGCLLGLEAAVEALEAHCLRDNLRALRHLGCADSDIDEVMQRLRTALLLGEGEQGPVLRGYGGRGPLRRFTRVVATRLARKLRAREAVHGAGGGDEGILAALPAPGDSPEFAHLKERYRAQFQAAFAAALAVLPAQERLLLRQHYVDGLTIDDLARIHQIHRATAARRVGRARDEVAEGTRRHLLAHGRLPAAELDSVLRLIRSQLDVSLRGLLASG